MLDRQARSKQVCQCGAAHVFFRQAQVDVGDEDPTSDAPESPVGDLMTRAHVANKASAVQSIHAPTHDCIVQSASRCAKIGAMS